MLRTGITLLAVAIGASTGHHSASVKRPGARPGCSSARCDRRVDRKWAEHHRPRVVASAWDRCIANKETGEPGSLNRGYINEHERTGIYSGAFQEERSKWVAGGGLVFASEPYEASWEQQLIVFHRHGRQGEWTYSNWPTIAGCEQYR